MGRSRKPVCGQLYRGFESLSLRLQSPKPLAQATKVISSQLSSMKPIAFLLLFLTSLASMSQTPTKYLALGDSYTIGESVTEAERWPVQLTEALRKKGKDIETPKIIATTGWRTDNLGNAINIANLKPGHIRV